MLKTEKSTRRASSSDRPSAGEEKTFGEDILIRVNRLECHVMGSRAGEQIEAWKSWEIEWWTCDRTVNGKPDGESKGESAKMILS